MNNAKYTSQSPAMTEIMQTIEKVASTDMNLLIVGEQGTGKEWMARFIHGTSIRSRKPFWAVDCDSISPENIEKEIFGFEALSRDGVIINRGAFEEAAGGTLLLNHIESLEVSVQKKIARALEYKSIHRIGGELAVSIDVRVIATNRRQPDTTPAMAKTPDEVFFRISPILIELPPLRDRREDIPLLVHRFISEMQSRRGNSLEGIAAEALTICVQHPWPGNIRNLRNAIEYASVMCSGPMIQTNDLPEYLLNNLANKTSFTARIS